MKFQFCIVDENNFDIFFLLKFIFGSLFSFFKFKFKFKLFFLFLISKFLKNIRHNFSSPFSILKIFFFGFSSFITLLFFSYSSILKSSLSLSSISSSISIFLFVLLNLLLLFTSNIVLLLSSFKIIFFEKRHNLLIGARNFILFVI